VLLSPLLLVLVLLLPLLPCCLVAATPRHRYTGMTVVELGSGPGLAGLLAAKLGAQVCVLTLLRHVWVCLRVDRSPTLHS
jgi:predicted nicotinamide N-methyase